MRRATLFSLPMEMKMLRSGEESRQRDGMKESTGKQGYGGGERFACIPPEEMKSFYRYTQCCQQLHRTCGSQLSDWTVNKVLALSDYDDGHLDEGCAL
ncbi:hypothetical protein D9C73_000516 [Collichthys lucidus]|uniref:Uncharacterized protein n=1 Tax=Collichthys lucidus TaxID=240159 RepID=A0A4U5TY85_COLLU|nr:hypothetical protein D9C73_000516 [Collichthys lucidus]